VRLGLVGNPVAHSLSPRMHSAALGAAGLAGEYVLLPTQPEELAGRMEQVRQQLRGVNVTVPYKEAVMQYLDQVSPEAKAIGAVNTVVNDAGKLVGHNTDAKGFLAGLAETAMPRQKVLVLGAGGGARAVVYALIQAGSSVWVYNRTPEKAHQLTQELGGAVLETLEACLEAAKTCDLLVNTTSVGLKDPTSTPISQVYSPVVDIIYNPPTTKLMQLAQEAGFATQNGLPMLVWQGALAFELWMGIKPDIKAMYKAVLSAPNKAGLMQPEAR
jgi:shikimate dehydrogenase